MHRSAQHTIRLCSLNMRLTMASNNKFAIEDYIIEFDIHDLKYDGCTILPDIQDANDKDSIIHTVMRTETFPEPVGQITGQVIYSDYASKLDELSWRLAELSEPAAYWMLADLDNNVIDELENSAVVAREVKSIYRNGPEGKGAAVIAKLDYESSLHITEWAGTGNMAGFHFFALPSDSKSASYFEELLQNPSAHVREIGDLCWAKNLILCDSIFEMRPFGVEDRDHLEIIISKSISSEAVRSILKDVYKLRYSIIRLSKDDFVRWENAGILEGSD